ncbi:MAG TPA: hypothetical protein VL574_13795 [Stellaceae bacterium]|nr:hypothetical protein [Stellaceae bacterium]
MRVTDLMALVTTTITPQASVETMMADIGAALGGHGVFTRVMSYAPAAPNEPLLHALIIAMRDSGLAGFMLDCNAKSDMVLEQRGGEVVTIHDGWNLPLVGFMVDHPAHHIPHLQRAPRKGLITVIDEDHLRFIADLGIKAAGRIFCPHGGPLPIPTQRDAADRPIDLLFIGNVEAESPTGAWLDGTSAGDAGLRTALAEAHDAVREDGIELYAALIAAFGRAGRDTSALALARFVQALDAHIARSRRLEMLQAIRSRRVTILGNVNPAAAGVLAHHDLRGPATFATALSQMAKAKLLLNSRVTFSGGAHERLFYGLSRGAVAVTEPSRFLAPDLAGGFGMVALPKAQTDIDHMVDGLLADMAGIDALRERGLPHYARHHSWAERTGRILDSLVETGLVPA